MNANATSNPNGLQDQPLESQPLEAQYNFAFLDETTKRAIRRSMIKAVCIPGFQVPFASRELPLPYGWGTGGVQCTAALLGPTDVLKVIDQGADDTTNAVSIRSFFTATAGVETTTSTTQATIVQTRHRIPETAAGEEQILVFQVPIPEPMRFLEPREEITRELHALNDYSLAYLRLYEDLTRQGRASTSYNHPVRVNGRYVMSPSPIPSFDNPKLHQSKALCIFGAGREQRIYAVPPFTDVRSLEFEDRPFTVETWDTACARCGSTESFLDEVIREVRGVDGQLSFERQFTCSDSDYCGGRFHQLVSAPQQHTEVGPASLSPEDEARYARVWTAGDL
jgi:alpha-D-ribose 1-methylphosphonate 5-phosphate C-P lyase